MDTSRPSSDEIARQAARILLDGRAAGIHEAIDLAVTASSHDGAPRPGEGRVRHHLSLMAMQAQGAEAYGRSVAAVLARAEQVMTTLEHAFEDLETRLAGRAARGLVDGGGPMHLRILTEQPVEAIGGALVELGYDEPAFGTLRSRFGVLSRLRVRDEDCEFLLTRCPPGLVPDEASNLVSGRPVPLLDLAGVRLLVATTGDETTV